MASGKPGQQAAWKQYMYKKKDEQKSHPGSQSDEQLAEDSVFFKYMLDLVPANFYFSQHTRDQLKNKKKPKRVDDDDDDDDDDSVDSSEEEEASAKKGKGKRKNTLMDSAEIQQRLQKKKTKYDPLKARTVTQLQQDLLDRDRKKAVVKAAQKQAKSSTQRADLTAALSEVPTSTEPEDLRQKLKSKLAELQAKRKATEYIDRIEKKKQKRRESKKRLKLKKQAEKQSPKPTKVKPMLINGLLTPTTRLSLVSPSKPIFNKEGKMVFSKFDFTDSRDVAKKSDLPTGSNYKQLLQKVERRKQKMQDLQYTDAPKAERLKEKITWTTALQKAEGVKVKDNPELLKKAIKKKEQKRDKRKKEWQDRTEKVEKHLQKQQDKRKRNIKKRKDLRIDKKIKKAKKKGRIVPGF